MQPNNSEILRAIVANLEELVVPQIQGAHAESALQNIVMLLEHVILRLGAEGKSLAIDNSEKRAVLAEIAEALGAIPNGESVGSGAGLLSSLEAIETAGPYVEMDSLKRENESLCEITNDWILRIHDARSRVGEKVFDELRAPLRAQLRAQMDREAVLVAPIDRARIFEDKDA